MERVRELGPSYVANQRTSDQIRIRKVEDVAFPARPSRNLSTRSRVAGLCRVSIDLRRINPGSTNPRPCKALEGNQAEAFRPATTSSAPYFGHPTRAQRASLRAIAAAKAAKPTVAIATEDVETRSSERAVFAGIGRELRGKDIVGELRDTAPLQKPAQVRGNSVHGHDLFPIVFSSPL